MMISPDAFADRSKEMTLAELMQERDDLFEGLKALENLPVDDEAWSVDPSPDVRYNVGHLYLARVCEAISEKCSEIAFEDEGDEEC